MYFITFSSGAGTSAVPLSLETSRPSGKSGHPGRQPVDFGRRRPSEG